MDIRTMDMVVMEDLEVMVALEDMVITLARDLLRQLLKQNHGCLVVLDIVPIMVDLAMGVVSMEDMVIILVRGQLMPLLLLMLLLVLMPKQMLNLGCWEV